MLRKLSLIGANGDETISLNLRLLRRAVALLAKTVKKRGDRCSDGSTGYVANFAASATVAVASPPALPFGEEIYDLMPAKIVALPIGYLLMQVATVLVAFWLLWLFYRWLTTPVHRQRRRIELSPQQMALRAIARLERSPIWQQHQMKEICESLAGILKVYAQDAYRVGIGSAATTDELLESFRCGGISGQVFARARDLLNQCDLIKFTGAQVDSTLAEEMLEDLRHLVTNEVWHQ
ncbi:MAG: hypothetical protein KKB51_11065 [Candidatus Riflebacteria bacterium]|nr:hypothetical protein [Candidatus Riflebacteria bacterium]